MLNNYNEHISTSLKRFWMMKDVRLLLPDRQKIMIRIYGFVSRYTIFTTVIGYIRHLKHVVKLLKNQRRHPCHEYIIFSEVTCEAVKKHIQTVTTLIFVIVRFYPKARIP